MGDGMTQNVSQKRRPGRPKGSKNKVRAAPVVVEEPSRAVQAQRARDSSTRDISGLRPYQKGQTGNPTGQPPGYVPYGTAYKIAQTLPPDELAELAEGRFPSGWHRERSQAYCIGAAAILRMRKETPPALLSEIADRSDGKVPQTIKQTVELQGIIALPAPRGLDTWATVIDAHLVEAPALPPGSDT
jgi:hypothetical protein